MLYRFFILLVLMYFEAKASGFYYVPVSECTSGDYCVVFHDYFFVLPDDASDSSSSTTSRRHIIFLPNSYVPVQYVSTYTRQDRLCKGEVRVAPEVAKLVSTKDYFIQQARRDLRDLMQRNCEKKVDEEDHGCPEGQDYCQVIQESYDTETFNEQDHKYNDYSFTDIFGNIEKIYFDIDFKRNGMCNILAKVPRERYIALMKSIFNVPADVREELGIETMRNLMQEVFKLRSIYCWSDVQVDVEQLDKDLQKIPLERMLIKESQTKKSPVNSRANIESSYDYENHNFLTEFTGKVVDGGNKFYIFKFFPDGQYHSYTQTFHSGSNVIDGWSISNENSASREVLLKKANDSFILKVGDTFPNIKTNIPQTKQN